MKKLNLILFFLAFSLAYAQSPVPDDAELEFLASGFQQPEGPVWSDSLGLLFSDIKANILYQWSPVDSSLTQYLPHSDSSNGLTFDLQGRLILTQMELRRVARQEFDGTITPLASTYKGKKFNSPNDVVVKSDGAIFFTDPNFNIPLGQHQELPYAGIYRIDTSGNVTLLDSTLELPNGICFSPDESKLYVNDSHKCKIYVWDVVNDSTIADKQLLCSIPSNGYADGMKIDSAGNIFCTGPVGVWVFSHEGTLLDTIVVPGNASNCNWGDKDRKTLYITASKNNIYRIRLVPKTTTDAKDHGSIPANFKLYQNFPNPFNPNTTIRFTLPKGGFTRLEIFNELGNKIEDLVNKYMPSGNYNVNFNASGYASGIYYYKLASSNFTSTGKMVYLK
jgi:gluconolactonase